MAHISAILANDIAINLNSAIENCKNGLDNLSEQATKVNEAASQMNTVIDDTTNATISVTEKIQDATDEINKNYELSKELDAGFEKVDTSVRAGNNEVNVVKNTLSEMAEIRLASIMPIPINARILIPSEKNVITDNAIVPTKTIR
jgi:methyl-accepting chemotaxis protein